MKIVSIANQKGGVGKSTTVQALAAGLSLKGYRVLVVDLDPQGNFTYATGFNAEGLTAYEMLTGKATAQAVVAELPQWQRMHIIPAGRELIKADLEITATGKEYRLKEALEPLAKKYDYVVLDTPPALGILTINALTASNLVIIPAQADIYSLQGIGQLADTIGTVRKYCNQSLKIQGVLLTRYNARTILSRDMAEMMEQAAKGIKTFVYKAVIRESVVIKEAQASRMDIFTYAPNSNVCTDYMSFVEEFAGRSGRNAKHARE